MAKVWVLQTETKGTGAHMVPLEKTLKKPVPSDAPIFVPRKRDAEPEAPEPRRPPKFKVVDAMTNQVLAENAGTRATVDLLRDVRSVVDVRVYAWEPKAEKSRLLRFADQKALWALRERRPA